MSSTHKRLKKTITLSGAILALSISAPAFAQYDNNAPQQYASNDSVSFPSNYPWFNNSVPQGESFREYLQNNPTYQQELEANPGELYDRSWRDQRPGLQSFLRSNPELWRGLQSQSYGMYSDSFGSFLANHPQVAAELRMNPDFIYDRNYLNSHPQLAEYLSTHPNVWRSLTSSNYQSNYTSNYSSGYNPNHWGAYDSSRQWRDAYWWHDNQPDLFYQNYSQWASLNPAWLAQDGAYDNQHQWHYGKWWYQQNPNWVSSNHPNWIQQHRYWVNQQAIVTTNNNYAALRERQIAVHEANVSNRQLQANVYEQNRLNHRSAVALNQENRHETRQLAVREQQNRHELQHQAMRAERSTRQLERSSQHQARVENRQQNRQAAHVEHQQNREARHEVHAQAKQSHEARKVARK